MQDYQIPKGVAYVGAYIWQVYNPYKGVFCIRPAATTGIYVNQVFPLVTVDLTFSEDKKDFVPLAYYRSDAKWCRAAFGGTVATNPYIEVDTYLVESSHNDGGDFAVRFWRNQVGFNLVVQ